ncbi:MAG TPA: carboxypeptidase-like regulatory domain-containing protein [Pirellulaceae bacterium]|nr:carboxypeptidase-like regulatory domain-containing protein [Pirellulaceae bacterium]
MAGDELTTVNLPSLAPGQLRRGSWRPRQAWRWLTSRSMLRALISLGVLLLCVALWYLLAQPFWHPRTRIVVLTPSDEVSLEASSTRNAASDSAAWQHLLPALDGRTADRITGLNLESLFTSPEQLTTRLNQIGEGDQRVAIISLLAQFTDKNNQAVLRTRNHHLDLPPPANIAFADLLPQIQRGTPGVKLVIVDLGDVATDLRDGIITNTASQRVGEAVTATGDRSLWVLVSHRSGQISHASTLLGQNVFGYFITRGLAGAADNDQSGSVDLRELHHYVRDNVSAWVAQESAGAAQQEPQLFWGGGDSEPITQPAILPVVKAELTSTSLTFTGILTQRRQQLTDNPSPFARLVKEGQDSAVSDIRSSVSRAADALTPEPVRRAIDRASSFASRLKPSSSGAQKKADDKSAAPTPSAAPAGKDAVAPSPAEQAAALLLRGWQLRDELASRARHGLSPVDFAPELWREYEALLLSAERQLRFGSSAAAADVTARLQRDILPLDKLYDLELTPPADPQSLAEKIAAALPRNRLPLEDLPSLGMAEVASELAGLPLPAGLQAISTSFDRWLAAPTAEQLATWLSEEPTKKAATLREVQLAQRLRAAPEIDFELAAQLLAARYTVERLAAQPLATSVWLRAQVLEADRWTTEAERCVFDRVRPDWRASAARLIEQTSQRATQLTADIARLKAIQTLRADLVYNAPEYVALHGVPLAQVEPETLQLEEHNQLLAALAQLNTLLDSPQAERWNELLAASSTATKHAARIELLWQATRLRAAIETVPQAGQPWVWERLLATTLVDASSRLRMIGSLPARASQLAERFLEPAAWQKLVQAQPAATPAQISGVRQRRVDSIRRLTMLQFAAGSPSDLLTTFENAKATSEQLSRALPAAARELSGMLDLAEAAEQRLKYAAERPVALAELRGAMLAGRLIDARDAALGRWPPIAATMQRVQAFQVYELGYERALAARRGAQPAESGYQELLATRYIELASQLAGQPTLPDPTTPAVVVELPDRASLMEVATLDLPLRIASERSYEVPVWLALDYDRAALRVELIGTDQFTALPELSSENAARANYFKPGAIAPDFAPSFTLTAGKSLELRLRVKRLGLSELPARIVTHVVTRESAARFTTEVELPTRPRMQLVVRGISGTWLQTSDELRLQPFANRQTTYEFDLTSLVELPLTGDVRIFVPTLPVVDLPTGGVPAATAQRILARSGAGKPWGVAEKLSLARRDATLPLKFVLPKPDEDEKAPAAPPPMEAAPAAAADAPQPLPFGLIAAIRDDSLQRVTLVHLPAMPQRPRRFLRATAGYSERRQRVELRISALDEQLLPREGVRVHADFASALAAGAQARTSDVVSGAGEVLLTGEIPPQAGRTVTVSIDVDDYPRAFTFDVPCFGERDNIAARERVDLEVARLPSGKSYKAPAATMPVELRIDLPSTALLDGADRLEVGIDERSDRELRGDPVVRLFSDRQAEILLAPLGEDGLVHLTSRVGDLKVDVPTAGLQNLKANVLVRAVIGEHEQFSPPVEVMLDGAAPHFELPQLTPSRTVNPGTEVTLSMLMVDKGQSGVDKVEVAIDAGGTGAFGEKAAPLPAVLNKAGRYEVKLPTVDLAPGSYTLLVRASDRVGNVSDFMPLKGLIIASTGAEGGDTTNTITGLVQFGKKNLEGFEVTLTSEPPVVLAPALTNARGQFTIKGVPAGKYKVIAQGVVRNKVSRGEVEITVKPPPELVAPVELQVR